jgi:predicted site-specific integrase-resolvase
MPYEGGDVQVSDDLIDSSEAATILEVSDRTVRSYARGGDLAIARRRGGKRGEMLFRRSEVQALAQRLQSGEA